METSITTFSMVDWTGVLFLPMEHSSAWIRRMLLQGAARFELHSTGLVILATNMCSNTYPFNRTRDTAFLVECACNRLQPTAGQDFRFATVTIWADSLFRLKILWAPQVGWNSTPISGPATMLTYCS